MPLQLANIPFTLTTFSMKTARQTSRAATDDENFVTLLRCSDDPKALSYKNDAISGWRNWKKMGSALIAQHPTEDWFVRVDSASVLEHHIQTKQPLEELSLCVFLEDKKNLLLGAPNATPAMPSLNMGMLHFRVHCKGTAFDETEARYISHINLADNTVTISNAKYPMFSVTNYSFFEFCLKYELVGNTPLSLLNQQQHFPDLAASPRGIYYFTASSENGEIKLYDNFRTEYLRHLDELARHIEDQLHEVFRAEGKEFTIPTEYKYSVSPFVSIEAFFSLCEQGWYFSPWLTPQCNVVVRNTFGPQLRGITLRQNSEVFNNFVGQINDEALDFEYGFTADNKHHLVISFYESSNKDFKQEFFSDSYAQMAEEVKAWLLANVATIQLSMEVTALVNEHDQFIRHTIHL